MPDDKESLREWIEQQRSGTGKKRGQHGKHIADWSDEEWAIALDTSITRQQAADDIGVNISTIARARRMGKP